MSYDMTLQQMQNFMTDIVQKVSRKYTDGESYFTEIDRMVKDDTELLVSFCKYVYNKTRNPIIFSGEIGDRIFKLHGQIKDFPVITVNGGLRSGREITNIRACNYYYESGTKLTMIDDSYYSGKTVRKIQEYLQEFSLQIENVFVFYDGSIEKRNNVFSLYRYYD